jgi:hypothetical protein
MLRSNVSLFFTFLLMCIWTKELFATRTVAVHLFLYRCIVISTSANVRTWMTSGNHRLCRPQWFSGLQYGQVCLAKLRRRIARLFENARPPAWLSNWDSKMISRRRRRQRSGSRNLGLVETGSRAAIELLRSDRSRLMSLQMDTCCAYTKRSTAEAEFRTRTESTTVSTRWTRFEDRAVDR